MSYTVEQVRENYAKAKDLVAVMGRVAEERRHAADATVGEVAAGTLATTTFRTLLRDLDRAAGELDCIIELLAHPRQNKREIAGWREQVTRYWGKWNRPTRAD